MKLKDYSNEQLESMSYSELALLILDNEGKKMRIVDIFKKICKLLNLSDNEFENKVVDFFELITTDKNFIILDKGYCDLRKKHTPKLIIEEDDDSSNDNDIIEEETEESSEEHEDDIYYDNSSEEDDVEDDDDDLNDLIILDEEDEEAGI